MTFGPHELRTEDFARLIERLDVLPRIGNDAAGNLGAWGGDVKHFSHELLHAFEVTRNGLRNVASRDDQQIRSMVEAAADHLYFARMADRSPWMWDALFGISGRPPADTR